MRMLVFPRFPLLCGEKYGYLRYSLPCPCFIIKRLTIGGVTYLRLRVLFDYATVFFTEDREKGEVFDGGGAFIKEPFLSHGRFDKSLWGSVYFKRIPYAKRKMRISSSIQQQTQNRRIGLVIN